MTQITSVLAIATVFIGYGLYYLHFIVTKGGLMRWGGGLQDYTVHVWIFILNMVA